jgi:hypothetical protein
MKVWHRQNLTCPQRLSCPPRKGVRGRGHALASQNFLYIFTVMPTAKGGGRQTRSRCLPLPITEPCNKWIDLLLLADTPVCTSKTECIRASRGAYHHRQPKTMEYRIVPLTMLLQPISKIGCG